MNAWQGVRGLAYPAKRDSRAYRGSAEYERLRTGLVSDPPPGEGPGQCCSCLAVAQVAPEALRPLMDPDD